MKQRGCSYFRSELESQYKVSNLGLKAEIRGRDPLVAPAKERNPVVAQTKGKGSLVTQVDLSAPHVCSPAVALLHKKSLRQRKKICANSLWLHSNYTKSLPSKNKNINYIFIYVRVFRCLSSGAIYDTSFSWVIIFSSL